MIAVLLAYLSTLALSLDMSATQQPLTFRNFAESFTVSPVLQLALCFVLYKLFSAALCRESFKRIPKRRGSCTLILSLLFAAFVLIGNSFYVSDSLGQIICGKLGMLKSLIRLSGLSVLFFFGLNLVFEFLDNSHCCCVHNPHTEGKGIFARWCRLLYERPFPTAFVTMFVCYIPYAILSYPMIAMGDTVDIIAQMYFLPVHLEYVQLIDETVTLNNAHPVAFTLLVHLCLQLGMRLFNSPNFGIYILSLIQLFVSLAVFSCILTMMVRMGARLKLLLGLMLFFIAAPNIQEYMMINTKDVLYMCSFLLYCCAAFSIIRGGRLLRHEWLWFAVSVVLIFFMRNEGAAIIALSIIPFMLAVRGKQRRNFVLVLLAVVVCYFGFNNVLLPHYKISPGSRREPMSVPFQQTARYVRDFPEDVTPEEREAISAVLKYDELAERYEPRKADRVKATFNEDASSQQVRDYMKVWGLMFFKHPLVYIEATLNNYFNYFYPSPQLVYSDDYPTTEQLFEIYDRVTPLKDYGISFSYPQALRGARLMYENVREALFTMPVFSVFKSTAVYFWLFMISLLYLIYRKEYLSVVAFVPVLLNVITCFLGPCNGDYFRYAYAISVAVPALSCVYLCAMKNKE